MANIQTILEDCDLNVSRYESVHGGDINDAYCIYIKTEKYFLKVNDSAKYPAMFEKEARGLLELKENFDLVAPEMIRTGIIENNQYLILSWLERGRPSSDTMKVFGEKLAHMHLKVKPYYGFIHDNYIGSLQQQNTSCENWDEFFSEHRVLPLIRLLYDQNLITGKHLKLADSFLKNINGIFPNEHPSLLHGDLWAGNYMITSTSQVAIFDPAVYYGHREMDLGMTKLFGGFGNEFYVGYNDVYPLQQDWQKRIAITQLYPLLVHAVLFGGHYIGSALEIIDKYG